MEARPSPPRRPLELPPGVRRVAPADVAQVARVLARAFHDDPAHRWLLPSERAWARHSHRTFDLLLRQTLADGTALTSDGLAGAALWNAPDAPQPGLAAQLAFGARMLWRLGPRIPRALRGFHRVGASHPPRPHWYRGVLGTDPSQLGRGVGSALVDAVLARADADGVPAWLEASRPENVPYYRRFGFELVCEIPLPGGPAVFGMLREPRGSG